MDNDEQTLITLPGADGKDYEFEIVAFTKENEQLYAILYPTNGDTELYIVRVEDGPTPDTATYIPVENQALIDKIYNNFKASKPEGFNFED